MSAVYMSLYLRSGRAHEKYQNPFLLKRYWSHSVKAAILDSIRPRNFVKTLNAVSNLAGVLAAINLKLSKGKTVNLLKRLLKSHLNI